MDSRSETALDLGLVCVECHGSLRREGANLACLKCGRPYEVIEGIPIMLADGSRERSTIEDARWKDHPIEGQDVPVERAVAHKKDYIRLFGALILDGDEFGSQVLEIGAGSCWASALVKKKYPECDVNSSDVSVNALLKGRKVSAMLGAQVQKLVVCHMQRLPFPDSYFDTVFGIGVLHHADDPQAAIDEIYRVLKPGGRYRGMREGLASGPLKPLYRRFSHGNEEMEHFRAVENVYTYDEWIGLFRKFTTRISLKHSFTLGVAKREKVYYLLAGLLPYVLLRRLTATIVVDARKPLSQP